MELVTQLVSLWHQMVGLVTEVIVTSRLYEEMAQWLAPRISSANPEDKSNVDMLLYHMKKVRCL